MSLPYRLGGASIHIRPNEETITPKRVIFLSVEGTKTEVNYFSYVEQYKNQLGIDAIVHIEVLRKHDTNSDPENVLDLLEEYVQFRNNDMFTEDLEKLNLKDYSIEFIRKYINDTSSLSKRERNKFEAVLRSEHIDLLYLDFLSKYHGDHDVFGIVIDRDRKSHTELQINNVIEKCRKKGFEYFLTNPCIEFWLLLHVSDVAVEYADKLEDILENAVDDQKNTFISNLLFEKIEQRKHIQKKTFEEYFLPNIDVAISRNKGFASKEELLDKIGSNLDELFSILREPV